MVQKQAIWLKTKINKKFHRYKRNNVKTHVTTLYVVTHCLRRLIQQTLASRGFIILTEQNTEYVYIKI